MSGVLRQAFRRLTSLESRIAIRNMSQDSKQIEGGRKPQTMFETLVTLSLISVGVLGLPGVLMLTRERPKDTN